MADQSEFDFQQEDLPEMPHDVEERGFRAFLSERERAIRDLEEKYGVFLNRRVRLRLFGWDEDFEGVIRFDQLIVPGSRTEEIQLRMGSMTFTSRDIEACIRLKEPE